MSDSKVANMSMSSSESYHTKPEGQLFDVCETMMCSLVADGIIYGRPNSRPQYTHLSLHWLSKDDLQGK